MYLHDVRVRQLRTHGFVQEVAEIRGHRDGLVESRGRARLLFLLGNLAQLGHVLLDLTEQDLVLLVVRRDLLDQLGQIHLLFGDDGDGNGDGCDFRHFLLLK